MVIGQFGGNGRTAESASDFRIRRVWGCTRRRYVAPGIWLLVASRFAWNRVLRSARCKA